MSENVATKLSEEELTPLRELANSFNRLIVDRGQIEFQLYDMQKIIAELERQVGEVEKKYEELKQTERKLTQDINGKYGVGTLNIETGIFTSENPKK